MGCVDNVDKKISDNPQNSAQKIKEYPPSQVSVITIATYDLSVDGSSPGRVQAFKTAEIRPQVSGIIQSRLFKEGSFVKKGQQLYQIDPARYEVAYQSANASLQSSEAELELALALRNRFQSLLETNAVSPQEFDTVVARVSQSKAAIAVSRAEMKAAKINLNYTKVYAPISGYIGSSTVTEGALVTAQQQAFLAIIRQLDQVYVDLSQSVSDAKIIQHSLLNNRNRNGEDKKFEVTLQFGNNDSVYPLKGSLYASDLAVDESTGTVRIRALFPNPNGALLPGMYVRASIEKMETQKIIMVPQKAISLEADGTKSVWIVDSNNVAKIRKVSTKTTYKNNWVINSGLEVGDNVIVKGAMSLQKGAKVVPTNIKSEVSNLPFIEVDNADGFVSDASKNKTSLN